MNGITAAILTRLLIIAVVATDDNGQDNPATLA